MRFVLSVTALKQLSFQSLVAVLELWRREIGPKFHEEDEEIGYSYLVWGGIALHYMSIYINLNKQKKLNDFLLAVVK